MEYFIECKDTSKNSGILFVLQKSLSDQHHNWHHNLTTQVKNSYLYRVFVKSTLKIKSACVLFECIGIDFKISKLINNYGLKVYWYNLFKLKLEN